VRSGDAGNRAFVAWLLLAAVAIVAYDAAMAWVSGALGFPYAYALVGSCLLYGTFGFLAARRFGMGRALLLGAWIGLIDASAGWAVSWSLGANRLAGGAPSFGEWLPVAALVATVALVCAAAGAGLGVLTGRRER
jgi:hypothetical protein